MTVPKKKYPKKAVRGFPKFNRHAEFPLGRTQAGYPICRCCGIPVYSFDAHPIHTKCIPRHWGKHSHGINASKCYEFHHLAEAKKRK